MATLSGTVQTLTGKGFGFIAAADGHEYFFSSIGLHWRSV